MVGKSHLILVSLSFLINNMGIKTSNPEVLFQGSREISDIAVPCKVKRAVERVIITLNTNNRLIFVPLYTWGSKPLLCVFQKSVLKVTSYVGSYLFLII